MNRADRIPTNERLTEAQLQAEKDAMPEWYRAVMDKAWQPVIKAFDKRLLKRVDEFLKTETEEVSDD